MTTTTAPTQVGIFVYDRVEELDFVGPFETFHVAGNQVAAAAGHAESACHVFTVAEAPDVLATSGGLRVQPDFTFADHPPIDVLVVPGGYSGHQAARPAVVEWLGRVGRSASLATSVCTGAFLLATVGLLQDRPATTHWASLDRLAAEFPTIDVRREVRWVEAGDVITAAGISAGIDMSLHVVQRLFGEEIATRTATFMEYVWNQNPTR